MSCSVSKALRLLMVPAMMTAALVDATAQGYPNRPIKIIVPLGAGGGVDTTARVVGQKLSEAFGQPVVIENRPGAGGTIATELVARAAPDGYTLVMASPGHTITPSLYKLSFDALKDFSPVTLILTTPYVVVVHPSLPVRSMKELVALGKAKPGELLWSSAGNGSAQHLTMELINMLGGSQLTHVAYKGTGPGMTDLIAGRISASSASVVSTLPHVKAGRLRALAVTGRSRSQVVPELPTVAEAGVKGFEMDVWHGAIAPAGTPADVVNRLHAEISRIIAQPETRDRLLGSGFETIGDGPEKFSRYLAAEVDRWAKVVTRAKIRID
jgi:tripartite-type tricarboxylate transporter receptor subunit TctC